MATGIFEAFSISHAAILNGTTGAEEAQGDIYGVREGSLEPDIGEFDNTGDDNVLSSWFWFNYADVNIVSGYLPFRTLALITGDVVTSSGTAPADHFNIDLWSEKALNMTARPLLLRCPSRDSAGAIRILDIVLYKVIFKPITLQGPVYKDGLVVNYQGRAVLSSLDEKGTVLTTKAIGRLVNKPGV